MLIENIIAIEKNQTCKFFINESVVPNTVHAAIDKGAHYFNI